jgi:hypothetical protein
MAWFCFLCASLFRKSKKVTYLIDIKDTELIDGNFDLEMSVTKLVCTTFHGSAETWKNFLTFRNQNFLVIEWLTDYLFLEKKVSLRFSSNSELNSTIV